MPNNQLGDLIETNLEPIRVAMRLEGYQTRYPLNNDTPLTARVGNGLYVEGTGFFGSPRKKDDEVKFTEEELDEYHEVLFLEGEEALINLLYKKRKSTASIDKLLKRLSSRDQPLSILVFRHLKGETVAGITDEVANDFIKQIKLSTYLSKGLRLLLHKPPTLKDNPISSVKLEDIVEKLVKA